MGVEETFRSPAREHRPKGRAWYRYGRCRFPPTNPTPGSRRCPPPRSTAVRRLLRRARPYGRAQRLARAGRRPTLLFANRGWWAEEADRGRETLVRARRGRPALHARGRRAPDDSEEVAEVGRRRGHAFFEMLEQVELLRLLGARDDPMGEAPADGGLLDSVGSGSGLRPAGGDGRAGASAGRGRACRGGACGCWGDVDKGDDDGLWRVADAGRCGPCSEIRLDRGARVSRSRRWVQDHNETARAGSRCGPTDAHGDREPATRQPQVLFATEERRRRHGARPAGEHPPGQVPANYDTDVFAPIHEYMRGPCSATIRKFGERALLRLPGHHHHVTGFKFPSSCPTVFARQ